MRGRAGDCLLHLTSGYGPDSDCSTCKFINMPYRIHQHRCCDCWLSDLTNACGIILELWDEFVLFCQKNRDREVRESNSTAVCSSSGACEMDEQREQSQQVWGECRSGGFQSRTLYIHPTRSRTLPNPSPPVLVSASFHAHLSPLMGLPKFRAKLERAAFGFSVLIQRFNEVLLHDCCVDEVAGHSSWFCSIL